MFSKLKNIFKNTKVINVVMAIVSLFGITYKGLLPAFDITTWLILICLIIVFNKVDVFDKKFKKEIMAFSIIFAFLNTLGNVTYALMADKSLYLFREIIRPVNVFYFIGIFNLIFVILKIFYPKIYKFKLKEEESKIKNTKKVFLITIIFILFCWLPYFIAFFPGILSYDSIEQLGFCINGFQSMSDHHPVLHTLFISFFYNIGYKLTGSNMLAVSLITIIQMAIMAMIFSAFIIFLHNRKVNDKVLIGVFIYYALVPLHGFYSITMWKDIIFAGSVLLLVMEIIKLIEKDNNKTLRIKDMVIFILISLLVLFFRNNGIYMYLLVILFGLILLKNIRLKLLLIFIIVLGIFGLIKGPVFNYFDIKKTESVEYLAIPIQQIGRMAYKNTLFDDEEKNLLNKLMPVDKIATEYNPKVSDGIKFSEFFNEDELNKNKYKYFKLWFNLVTKHFGTAVEAYLVSTVGYWYPSASHWTVFNYVFPNEFGLKNADIIPKLRPLMIKLESKSLPILNLEWSIGLCFWIILFMGSITIKRKGFKYIYPYIPILGIWLTMMVASPVFAEFRYIYSAFVTLPLLILMPQLKLKNE